MDHKIEWACETRFDLLDDQIIELMSKSGMKVVNLGIESSDQEILKQSGKKIALNKTQTIVEKLHANGIKVQAFFMLGLVNDSKQSMLNTINFAKHLNTFSAQFCVTTPFPGTRFFEDNKNKLIHTDWSKFTEYNPVMSIDLATPQEIEYARDFAYRTYYMSGKWLFRHGFNAISTIFS